MRTTKTLTRLCRCAGWFESSLGVHVRWYAFLHCSSYVKFCLVMMIFVHSYRFFFIRVIYIHIYMYNIHSIPVYIFFNPEALSHLCESASGFKKILTEMLWLCYLYFSIFSTQGHFFPYNIQTITIDTYMVFSTTTYVVYASKSVFCLNLYRIVIRPTGFLWTDKVRYRFKQNVSWVNTIASRRNQILYEPVIFAQPRWF